MLSLHANDRQPSRATAEPGSHSERHLHTGNTLPLLIVHCDIGHTKGVEESGQEGPDVKSSHVTNNFRHGTAAKGEGSAMLANESGTSSIQYCFVSSTDMLSMAVYLLALTYN